MSDTFLDSFNKAFMMGHTIENDKRMQQAAEQQAKLHQFQMYKMGMDLQNAAQLQQQREAFASAMRDPQVMESAISSYAPEAREAAKKAIEYAASTGDDKFLKQLPKKAEGSGKNELKMSNAVEEAMASVIPGFINKPDVRQAAYDKFGSDPKFSQAILDKAAQISISRQAPVYSAVQTSEGIVPFKVRGANAGSFKPDAGKISKPMPETANSKSTVLLSILKDADQAEKLYDSKDVGPVMGRIGALKESYTDKLTEKQALFYQIVRNLQDTELRKRSGAQINEQEMERLRKFLPDPNLPAATFKARLRGFKYELNNLIDETSSLYAAQGYDTGEIKKRQTQINSGDYPSLRTNSLTNQTENQTPIDTPRKYRIIQVK